MHITPAEISLIISSGLFGFAYGYTQLFSALLSVLRQADSTTYREQHYKTRSDKLKTIPPVVSTALATGLLLMAFALFRLVVNVLGPQGLGYMRLGIAGLVLVLGLSVGFAAVYYRILKPLYFTLLRRRLIRLRSIQNNDVELLEKLITAMDDDFLAKIKGVKPGADYPDGYILDTEPYVGPATALTSYQQFVDFEIANGNKLLQQSKPDRDGASTVSFKYPLHPTRLKQAFSIAEGMLSVKTELGSIELRLTIEPFAESYVCTSPVR